MSDILTDLIGSGLSTVASAYESKKQKENLRLLRREIEAQKKESLEAIDTSISAARAPIEQEVSMMTAQRVARDPFEEAAIQQGAKSQMAAHIRKQEMSAGGIGTGGRVGMMGAMSKSVGQALMAKESMRLKKEGQLTQAIAQQSQGLANIELSGMQSRQDAMRSYGERISSLTDRIGSMPNVWRAAVTGGVNASLDQQPGAPARQKQGGALSNENILAGEGANAEQGGPDLMKMVMMLMGVG